MKFIAGIDPGLSGAIALLDGDTVSEIYDMPTIKTTVMATVDGKKKKMVRRRLDAYALARWFDLYGKDISEAFIENPQSKPTDGHIQAFRLGFNCGVAQAMVASQFVPVRLVPPATWKRAMGLTSDKDAVRLVASQMLPSASHMWPLVKHDGRAEAALLAVYGRRLSKQPH